MCITHTLRNLLPGGKNKQQQQNNYFHVSVGYSDQVVSARLTLIFHYLINDNYD